MRSFMPVALVAPVSQSKTVHIGVDRQDFGHWCLKKWLRSRPVNSIGAAPTPRFTGKKGSGSDGTRFHLAHPGIAIIVRLATR